MKEQFIDKYVEQGGQTPDKWGSYDIVDFYQFVESEVRKEHNAHSGS